MCFLTLKPKRGALNPNSVLCTDQAPLPGFCALNPGSALNPRTLHPGTTVLFCVFLGNSALILVHVRGVEYLNQRQRFQSTNFCEICAKVLWWKSDFWWVTCLGIKLNGLANFYDNAAGLLISEPVPFWIWWHPTLLWVMLSLSGEYCLPMNADPWLKMRYENSYASLSSENFFHSTKSSSMNGKAKTMLWIKSDLFCDKAKIGPEDIHCKKLVLSLTTNQNNKHRATTYSRLAG